MLGVEPSAQTEGHLTRRQRMVPEVMSPRLDHGVLDERRTDHPPLEQHREPDHHAVRSRITE